MSKQNTYQTDSIQQGTLAVGPSLKLDSIVKDTVYGISNEKTIPHRTFKTKELVLTTKTELELLFDPTHKEIIVHPWQTILLLLGLFIVGFSKAFSNNRFKQSVKALFNYSIAQEITREEKVFFHRANLLFTLNHVITASLFILYLNNTIHYSDNKHNFGEFLLIPIVVILIYSVKYIFSKVLFFIFNDNSISNEYIFNISLYNHLLGVLLIPVLGLCYFSDLSISIILTYFALPIISISFIMRLVRLMVLGKLKGVSYFYIFLYICTLEILPLVVLYRIFILN